MQLTSEWAPLPFITSLIFEKKQLHYPAKNNMKYSTFCPVNMQNKSINATASPFSKPGAQKKVLYHSICSAYTCEKHNLMNKDVIMLQKPADSRAAPLTSNLFYVAQSLFFISLLQDFTEYSELEMSHKDHQVQL